MLMRIAITRSFYPRSHPDPALAQSAQRAGRFQGNDGPAPKFWHSAADTHKSGQNHCAPTVCLHVVTTTDDVRLIELSKVLRAPELGYH